LATPVFNRRNEIHGALQVVGSSDILTKNQLNKYLTHFLKASMEGSYNYAGWDFSGKDTGIP